jgi:hypothetical protein
MFYLSYRIPLRGKKWFVSRANNIGVLAKIMREVNFFIHLFERFGEELATLLTPILTAEWPKETLL